MIRYRSCKWPAWLYNSDTTPLPPNPQVSRSFAAVIQQLPKVLAKDVMVFYLVLRGLDTVEDDMTAFKDIQVSIILMPVVE